MTDVATLTLAVDSLQVRTAILELDKLQRSGRKTQDSANEMSSAFRRTAQSVAAIQGPLGPLSGRLTSIGSLIGNVGIGFAGATLALSGTTFVAYKAVQAFKTLEMEQAAYNAVIKATGMAAGRTGDDVEELAQSIRKSTTATEGDVRKAAATLLTFRGVSGETFDRTLTLSKDLSVVLGGDMASAAFTIGRALENPIEGMTMLRRAGIMLTETQKQQIKLFLETGQRAKAVQIILDELTARVGGAGAAQGATLTGANNQLAEATNNLMERWGEQISKGIRLREVLLGIAGALDRTNKAAEKAASTEGRLAAAEAELASLQPAGRNMGVRRNASSPLNQRIESQRRLVMQLRQELDDAQLGAEMTAGAKRTGVNDADLQRKADAVRKVTFNVNEEIDALRKSQLQREIDIRLREAETSATSTEGQAIADLVRKRFELANSAQLLSPRIGILGAGMVPPSATKEILGDSNQPRPAAEVPVLSRRVRFCSVRCERDAARDRQQIIRGPAMAGRDLRPGEHFGGRRSLAGAAVDVSEL